MIVLDTHAWIWWASDPSRLSATARQAISEASASSTVHVSAISCWELALLVAKRRLELALEVDAWVARFLTLPAFTFVPLDAEIAVRSVDLPGDLHNDPADRIIVATARALDAPLVTKDQKLLAYPHATTIW